MYERLREIVERWMKIPPRPHAPLGDEDSLKVFRAAPNYYKYKLWFWRLSCIPGILISVAISIVLPIVLVATAGPLGLLAIPVGLALAVFFTITFIYSYVALRLDYEYRWYMVTDRSLRIREGVFLVREMTMTFQNIQDISLTQGPIQRMFKISDLKVKSAGGGAGNDPNNGSLFNMHEGYFRGVENASEIRDLVMARLRRVRGAGLGDSQDQTDKGDFGPGRLFTDSPDVLEALRIIRDETRKLKSNCVKN